MDTRVFQETHLLKQAKTCDRLTGRLAGQPTTNLLTEKLAD